VASEPSTSEHDDEPLCEVCGGVFSRELETRQPPQCVVCRRAGRMILQVRWLLDSKDFGAVARNVGDVYLTIASLLSVGRPEGDGDDPVAAAELERSDADKVTALAIVAARRWRLRGAERELLQQRSREQGESDSDVVKVDLCRSGVVSALGDLGRHQRYRQARRWTEGAPSDDLLRRTLRWIFARVLRVARDALQTEGVRSVGYVEGTHGATPADDGLAGAWQDLAEVDEGEDLDPRLRRLLDNAAPRQRELVEALRKRPPGESIAAVARRIGMKPNAAYQSYRRFLRQARKHSS
jgi:hypothetical protein